MIIRTYSCSFVTQIIGKFTYICSLNVGRLVLSSPSKSISVFVAQPDKEGKVVCSGEHVKQNIEKITDAKAFNLIIRYIDNVLSINNPNFDKWIPLRYHKQAH